MAGCGRGTWNADGKAPGDRSQSRWHHKRAQVPLIDRLRAMSTQLTFAGSVHSVVLFPVVLSHLHRVRAAQRCDTQKECSTISSQQTTNTACVPMREQMLTTRAAPSLPRSPFAACSSGSRACVTSKGPTCRESRIDKWALGRWRSCSPTVLVLSASKASACVTLSGGHRIDTPAAQRSTT